MIGAIRFYQRAVSPLTPPTCRFTPSCSAYAAEAITTHGLARGGWLALRRVVRCHPFGGMGYDPVPLPAGRRPEGPRRARGEDVRTGERIRNP